MRNGELNGRSRGRRRFCPALAGIWLLLLLSLVGCGAAAKEEAAEETESAQEVPPELVLDNFLTEEGKLDLAALKRWNEDCCGWIVLENTELSFPLLYAEAGDSRYLSLDFWGEEDEKGSIYLESLNAADFSDYNTVIYGRNVAGRFASLHQYREKEFFDGHRDVTVYLEDVVLKYRIFAAYPYDDRHLLYSFDFADRNVYSMYLGEVLAQRGMDVVVDNSDDVTAVDRIITLSTGISDQPEKRFLVQAVQLSE